MIFQKMTFAAAQQMTDSENSQMTNHMASLMDKTQNIGFVGQGMFIENDGKIFKVTTHTAINELDSETELDFLTSYCNEKELTVGMLWWIADDVSELGRELGGRLSHPNVTLLKVDKHPDSEKIDYVFALPREDAERILGYKPEESEWLED